MGNTFEVLCQDIMSSKSLIEGDKIGIENDISYGQYKTIAQIAGDNLTDITTYITALRNIKTEFEIASIKKAQSVTELAYNQALKIIKEGVSEVELAAYIEYVMKKNGC